MESVIGITPESVIGITGMRIEADLAMKQAALKRVHDLAPRQVRFKAPDRLLAFLEAL